MAGETITAERAREILEYNPATGQLCWRNSRSTVRAGAVAGTIDKDGYVCIRADGKTYKAHRLVWLIIHGVWPAGQIDHINRVKSDNRIENLRDATQELNQRNRDLRKDNISGVTGVYLHKQSGRWAASINNLEGRQVFLGLRDTMGEAITLRKEAEKKYGY